MASSGAFRDFCLTCDREAPDGLYCSQSCRLLDLEKGDSPYTPKQPYVQPTSPSQQRSYNPTTNNQPSSPQRRQLASTASARRPSSSYDTAPKTFSNRALPAISQSRSGIPQQKQRTMPSLRQGGAQQSLPPPGEPLTPSSSQDSLASNSRSNFRSADPNTISHEAQMELQEYYRSFDQTRARKRRQSMY